MHRREFGLLSLGAGALRGAAQKTADAETGSHIGNLYPFVQKQADWAPVELSFLRAEFRDLRQWQKQARAKIFEHMFYAPPPVDPDPQVIRRTDRGDYVEERLTFKTTPDLRVPAYVLAPKKTPAPGIVALHDHGGFYLGGRKNCSDSRARIPF